MESTLFTEVFGNGGAIAGAFSGLWFMVGIFVALFFILYLYSRKSGTENLVVFILLFIGLAVEYTLFDFPLAFIIIMVVGLTVYIAQFMYYWFNK